MTKEHAIERVSCIFTSTINSQNSMFYNYFGNIRSKDAWTFYLTCYTLIVAVSGIIHLPYIFRDSAVEVIPFANIYIIQT